MNSCCQATDQHFDKKHAQKDLKRFKSKGPDATTKALLSLLDDSKAEIGTHLDIGCGIGVISFELLNHGIETSTLIDASSAYLEIASTEAKSQGLQNRIKIIHGDAVEEVEKLSEADLVTLDRVICCYPSVERLIAASTPKAGRWYALSYPRNRWFVRLGVHLENLLRKLQSNTFRTFVHDPPFIEKLILSAGFVLHSRSQTATWQMALYQRV